MYGPSSGSQACLFNCAFAVRKVPATAKAVIKVFIANGAQIFMLRGSDDTEEDGENLFIHGVFDI
jgi:hypothetical protein